MTDPDPSIERCPALACPVMLIAKWERDRGWCRDHYYAQLAPSNADTHVAGPVDYGSDPTDRGLSRVDPDPIRPWWSRIP